MKTFKDVADYYRWDVRGVESLEDLYLVPDCKSLVTSVLGCTIEPLERHLTVARRKSRLFKTDFLGVECSKLTVSQLYFLKTMPVKDPALLALRENMQKIYTYRQVSGVGFVEELLDYPVASLVDFDDKTIKGRMDQEFFMDIMKVIQYSTATNVELVIKKILEIDLVNKTLTFPASLKKIFDSKILASKIEFIEPSPVMKRLLSATSFFSVPAKILWLIQQRRISDSENYKYLSANLGLVNSHYFLLFEHFHKLNYNQQTLVVDWADKVRSSKLGTQWNLKYNAEVKDKLVTYNIEHEQRVMQSTISATTKASKFKL